MKPTVLECNRGNTLISSEASKDTLWLKRARPAGSGAWPAGRRGRRTGALLATRVIVRGILMLSDRGHDRLLPELAGSLTSGYVRINSTATVLGFRMLESRPRESRCDPATSDAVAYCPCRNEVHAFHSTGVSCRKKVGTQRFHNWDGKSRNPFGDWRASWSIKTTSMRTPSSG
jgi:hypothetical protein